MADTSIFQFACELASGHALLLRAEAEFCDAKGEQLSDDEIEALIWAENNSPSRDHAPTTCSALETE